MAKAKPKAAEPEAPTCPYHRLACVPIREGARVDVYWACWACPDRGCSFRVKRIRPSVDARLERQRRTEEDFSAR